MLEKKFFDLKEVKEKLGLQDQTIEINDVKDMLKIVNKFFVPEPTLFDGCPVLLIERDEKKDVFIIWQEFGIAVRRYPGRQVYWLLMFNSAEEKFNPKRTVIIPNGTEMYKDKNLISYFFSAEEIAKAVTYIINAHRVEQELFTKSLTGTFDEEKPVKNDEPYIEDGEFRYNDRTGKEEWFPDWLGGMESEEEFWEH